MKKAVMISIHPEWCRMIESGRKTVEVRKTKPRLDPPFTCYIYQTLPRYGDWNERDGRVVGEFVCDDVFVMWDGYSGRAGDDCLSYAGRAEREEYLNGKAGYGWHISEFVRYDKPKKLGEFRSWNTGIVFKDGYPMPTHEIKRPPQSFMYVGELE